MPKVNAQGKTFECESGSNLRKVLLNNDIDLHNGNAKIINCRGIGTCGTCAVEIEGKVSESNWKEKTRLGLPPHSSANNRRL
ncbi:MAG: 2Fe-2S iron-sulfur cluster-binding protein, partial [Cyanobacteria bacterium J06573_2]